MKPNWESSCIGGFTQYHLLALLGFGNDGRVRTFFFILLVFVFWAELTVKIEVCLTFDLF